MPTTAVQPYYPPVSNKPKRSVAPLRSSENSLLGNRPLPIENGTGNALRAAATGNYPNILKKQDPSMPLKLKDGQDPSMPLVEQLEQVEIVPTDKNPDQFMNLLEQLGRLHHDQIDQLLELNKQLTTQLNTCLQATWAMSEDGWHGKPTEAAEATLVLTTFQNAQKHNPKAAWTVPENFENPMKVLGEEADNFTLRGVWKYTGEMDVKNAMRVTDARGSSDGRPGSKQMMRRSPGRASVSHQQMEEDDAGCCYRFMLDPSSSKRVAWDFLCAVILLYDVVMVPIGAFKPKESDFMIVMDWVTLLFWTSDMLASLFTGYTSDLDGYTVMTFKYVAINYLKGWFLLDVIIVGPDWVITIMDFSNKGDNSSGDGAKTTRLLRTFRMVRVMRLFRLVKLQKMLQRVKDNIKSELVFKFANIFQIFMGLLFVAHLISAGWYFLGDIGIENNEPNWIQVVKTSSGKDFEHDPVAYRYLTSLHWAIAHFGLGSMKVEPQSSIERAFSIFVTLFGILFFSFFTAYLANALVQANLSQTNSSKQLWLLRRYLRQHNVNSYLNYRVLRYAEFKCKNIKEILPEGQVHVLHELSEHLRSELKFEVSFSASVNHPLFQYMYKISDVAVQKLAIQSFSEQALGFQDMLFKEGSWETHMYIVVSGYLDYKKTEGEFPYKCAPASGDWMCESAMWVQWMTRGSAIAVSDCQIILVDVHTFSEGVCANDGMWAFVSHYSANYSEWINDQDLVSLVDVNMKSECKALAESFIHRHVDETEKDREKRLKKKRQERYQYRHGREDEEDM